MKSEVELHLTRTAMTMSLRGLKIDLGLASATSIMWAAAMQSETEIMSVSATAIKSAAVTNSGSATMSGSV